MQISEMFPKIEKCFNIAASIPVIAIPSSMVRVTLAEIQIVASAAIALIGLLGQMLGAHFDQWETITQSAKESFVHSILNLIRGLGELFLGLTVVGTLGLCAYQAANTNKFEPIFKYDAV